MKEKRMKMGFYVESTAYTEVTKESDPEEEFSGESTSTDHEVISIHPSIGKENRFNCVGNFTEDELSQVSDVYLVYLVYSTGDSFSQQDGSSIEFIHVFLTEDKAKRCAEQIRAHNFIYDNLNSYKPDITKIKEYGKAALLDGDKESVKSLAKESWYEVKFQDEKDEVQKCAADWNGYFESLDFVEVKKLKVKPTIKLKI